MSYKMINKIPEVREKKGLSITDLQAAIITKTGQKMSYHTLHNLAKDEANNQELSYRTNLGSISVIALAMGVTLDELVDIQLITA